MTPRALFRLDVPEGTRLVICALYNDEDVDGEVVRAWEEGWSAELPFVWWSAGYEALQDITGRSRSRVAEDLSRLVTLGVIRRATREGRRGWELLGTRRDPVAPPEGRPTAGTLGSQHADARVPGLGPGRPRLGPRRPSLIPQRRDPGPGPSIGHQDAAATLLDRYASDVA